MAPYYANAKQVERDACWRMVSRDDGYRKGSPTGCSDVPAPVLGELIGYSPRIVAKHSVDQAIDWNNYAGLKARDGQT